MKHALDVNFENQIQFVLKKTYLKSLENVSYI